MKRFATWRAATASGVALLLAASATAGPETGGRPVRDFGPLTSAKYHPVQYRFQAIDPPAALGDGAATEIAWINNGGLISVQYQTPPFNDWYQNSHAALVRRGVWTNIDVPGAAVTLATNPTSQGQVALTYTNYYPGNPYEAVWNVAIFNRGRYTPFAVSGYQLIANAINDRGQIAAAAIDSDGNWHCFAGTASRYAIFDYPAPDLAWSQVLGLNDHGVAVGSYAVNAAPLDGHAFVCDGTRFVRFDLPGAKWTNATSINNSGAIAGTHGMAGPDGEFDNVWHGFVIDKGWYTVVDVPGAVSTVPYWINDVGQVGGQFYDAGWGVHGFIATPQPGRGR